MPAYGVDVRAVLLVPFDKRCEGVYERSIED